MAKVVIWDIDNCIADDSRRIPLIDFKQRDPNARYDPYHKGCGDDPAANIDIVAEFAAKAERTVFMTSRPVKYRQPTQDWLKANVPILEKVKWSLMMRDDDDTRSSSEVKKAQLSRLSAYGVRIPEDVVAAFDDRKDVIEMYRLHGIENAKLLAIRKEDHQEHALGSPGGPMVPAQLLRAAAFTFEQRNAVYKDNYKKFGAALLSLFPDSTIPQISNADDANRLNLITDCLCKLQRYCYSFNKGGHKDSARDLMVYAAMLEENTIE